MQTALHLKYLRDAQKRYADTSLNPSEPRTISLGTVKAKFKPEKKKSLLPGKKKKTPLPSSRKMK